MQNSFKKIILILTLIILIVGVYFGITFYNKSKTNQIPNGGDVTNKDQGRTPFQTKISTSTDFDGFPSSNNETENPATTTSSAKPKLVQIWTDPVSGFDFVKKDIEIINTSTSTSASTTIKTIQSKQVLKNQDFIYIWDRKSGHIYENIASTTDLTKISNYTLPGAEEVFFGDNSSLIVRSLAEDNDTVLTRYIKLVKEFSTSTIYDAEIKNINIDSNNISFLPSAKKIFYFIKGTGSGIISSIDGVSKINAITTAITETLTQYVNKDLIAITTKPSAYFKGYLFTLNTNGTGKNNYIIGEKYGFNALVSPDGKKVIYNEIINDTLETFIYDIKSKSSAYLTQATLVEKCVWSANSKEVYCGIPQKLYTLPYPEAWYKDEISFSDNIWAIDVESSNFRLITPLQDLSTKPIDIYKIKISDDNKYLIFQDKNTLSLWKYTI